jgi:hypothetical protein
MPVTTAPAQERRRYLRSDGPARFAINLVNPQGAVLAGSVNVSEGGLCLRVQEELEVRALIQVRLTPAGSAAQGRRSVRCTGRVAWVIQRLDLRENPPFLYDVGIEFVDPPAMLRQMLARQGLGVPSPKPGGSRERPLASVILRGRTYVPRLERSSSPQGRWHLVVSIGGVPCFSRHYASERAALNGWEQFKRQHARRPA